jgi:hypothetical protein
LQSGFCDRTDIGASQPPTIRMTWNRYGVRFRCCDASDVILPGDLSVTRGASTMRGHSHVSAGNSLLPYTILTISRVCGSRAITYCVGSATTKSNLHDLGMSFRRCPSTCPAVMRLSHSSRISSTRRAASTPPRSSSYNRSWTIFARSRAAVRESVYSTRELRRASATNVWLRGRRRSSRSLGASGPWKPFAPASSRPSPR